MNRRLVYTITPLTDTTVVPKNENGDLEIIDDFHLCNIVVKNCCVSFTVLTILVLIIVLIIYLTLLSEWIETIGDPTSAIINSILEAQETSPSTTISGINTACYIGGLGVCTSGSQQLPQFAILKPTLN